MVGSFDIENHRHIYLQFIEGNKFLSISSNRCLQLNCVCVNQNSYCVLGDQILLFLNETNVYTIL